MNIRMGNQRTKFAIRRYRQVYNTVIISGLLTVFIHFCVSPEYPQHLVFATTSLLICLVIGFLLLFTKKMVHLPIFIPTFILWLYFCAPFLYSSFPDWDTRRVVDPTYFDEMALYSMLSITGLVFGYYGATKLIGVSPIFYPGIRLDRSRLTNYAWFFLLVWWFYTILMQITPFLILQFGQTIAILKHFNLFGSAFVLIAFLRGKSSFPLIFFALFSYLTDVFLTVQSSLFAWNAYLLLSLLLVIYAERRKFPWKTTMLILFLALPIFLARMTHRQGFRYWAGHFSERVVDGISIAIQDITSIDWAEARNAVKNQLGGRLEGVSFLAHCIYHHKSGKPFKRGETFWFIPLSVIPRAVFPWKPKNDHGDILSTEYGFKDPGGYVSINFLWLAELYINFNFIGMVLGSTFMGLFIGFASRCFGYGVGDFNLLIFIQMLYWLTNMESNLAMITGGILQGLVVWWLLSFCIKGGRLRFHRYSKKLHAERQILTKLTQNRIQPSLVGNMKPTFRASRIYE